jgi:hypothetical protein
MAENDQLRKELAKLNNRLDKITKKSKFMVYSANPFKFAFFNFIAGVFHFLGIFFGMFLLTGLTAYILSQINFGATVDQWLDTYLEKVQEKVENSLTVPGSYPLETKQLQRKK